MSKSQRYHAAGRYWTSDFTRRFVFPGATTAEEIGRIILHNRGKADRYFISRWHPRYRQALYRFKKTCMGGEYKRKIRH